MAEMGVILRNAIGEMITTRNGRRTIRSPLHAKGEVALLGLRTTLALGVTKFIIEGDSLIVIQALQEPLEECSIEIKIYIDDNKNILSCFQNVVIKHVSRLKNKIANRLAQDGSRGQTNYWKVS